MRRKLANLKIDFHHPRFTQISESHCGPAVVQMLLENIGIETSQEAIAEAAGAKDLIELNGTRVDQLAQAVRVLAPQAQFWWKDNARLKELILIVRKYHYPVAVEWQGVFDDDEGAETRREQPENGGTPETTEKPASGFTLPDSETQDDDYGHYSVVIGVRLRNRLLVIADPYKDYIHKDRIFSFRSFVERWWDYNEVPNLRTGRKRLVQDYHLMFIITEKGVDWPARLGMRKG